MEYVIGAVTALFLLVLGMVIGYLAARTRKPKEEAKSQEQVALDKQWESLFRYDGKEV